MIKEATIETKSIYRLRELGRELYKMRGELRELNETYDRICNDPMNGCSGDFREEKERNSIIIELRGIVRKIERETNKWCSLCGCHILEHKGQSKWACPDCGYTKVVELSSMQPRS